jgi:hypothetical protein
LKRAINSNPMKMYSSRSYSPAAIFEAGSQTAWLFPRIPNFVWLAMIVVAIGALSYSAYTRSDRQEQQAMTSYNETATRVDEVKSRNQRIREQTERIRKNPQTSIQSTQRQLRLLRPNEVVVSLR